MLWHDRGRVIDSPDCGSKHGVIMDNSTLLSPQALHSHWDPKYPFDLVIVYEDTTTRNRAVALYDHIAQSLVDDYDFKSSWWSYSEFANQAALDKAADMAGNANMVILALRSHSDPDPRLQQWMDAWLERKGTQKCAMVTLIAGFRPGQTEACPLQRQLHSIARSGQMDFFSHYFDTPAAPYQAHSRHIIPEISERASLVTPLMEEILDQKISFPRWGINE